MAREKTGFLVDQKGRKQPVLLPIGEYRELLEDLADPAVIPEIVVEEEIIPERKDAPAEALDVVRQRLQDYMFQVR